MKDEDEMASRKDSGKEGTTASSTAGLISLKGYYYTYGVPDQKERSFEDHCRGSLTMSLLEYNKKLSQLVTDKEEAEFDDAV